jgi:hypothetical protein
MFMFPRGYYYNIIPEVADLPRRLPDEIAFFVSCITSNGTAAATLCPRRFALWKGGAVKKSGEELATQLDDQKFS